MENSGFTSNMVQDGSSMETLDGQKDKQAGPRANGAEALPKAEMAELKLCYSGHTRTRRGSLEKTIMPGNRREQERGRRNTRGASAIKRPRAGVDRR